ncbi:hypothetical protein HK098_007226 [Nowakowskiella sp. JEL0407]|nr:hypothetical protein HK098_007226 [Nowakowskiella sp. JEL0407]
MKVEQKKRGPKKSSDNPIVTDAARISKSPRVQSAKSEKPSDQDQASQSGFSNQHLEVPESAIQRRSPSPQKTVDLYNNSPVNPPLFPTAKLTSTSSNGFSLSDKAMNDEGTDGSIGSNEQSHSDNSELMSISASAISNISDFNTIRGASYPHMIQTNFPSSDSDLPNDYLLSLEKLDTPDLILLANMDTLNQIEQQIPAITPTLSEFYMHLIKCFFTYFHDTLVIFDEKLFYERLNPNYHSPALLHAIFSIGCHFSAHPNLSQAPFYNTQNASDVFAEIARKELTTANGKDEPELLELFQTAILLSVSDLGKNGENQQTVLEAISSLKSQSQLNVTEGIADKESERTWISHLTADVFSSIINKTRLAIVDEGFASSLSDAAYEEMNGFTSTLKFHHDGLHWKNALLNPADTVFKENPQPSAAILHDVPAIYFRKLIFLSRRVLAINNRVKEGKSEMIAVDRLQLHNELVLWYESFPSAFKQFESLKTLATRSLQDLYFTSVIPPSERMSSLCVVTNILFFTILVLLHQDQVVNPSSTPTPGSFYRISFADNNAFNYTPLSICAISYKAQCFLLRLIYRSNCMPQPNLNSHIVPPELVSTPLIPHLIMPVAETLLSVSSCCKPLVAEVLQAPPHTFTNFDLDSLQVTFLPVMKNISRVWSCAISLTMKLDNLITQTKARLQPVNRISPSSLLAGLNTTQQQTLSAAPNTVSTDYSNTYGQVAVNAEKAVGALMETIRMKAQQSNMYRRK